MAKDHCQCLVVEAQARFKTDSFKREWLQLEERGGTILGGITAPILAASKKKTENWMDRQPIKEVVYSSLRIKC